MDFFGRLRRASRDGRLRLFKSFMRPSRGELIVDVGGSLKAADDPNISSRLGDPGDVVLVNKDVESLRGGGCGGYMQVCCDGRSLCFRDKSIDVVFSNAVLEHVGDFDEQTRFAGEVVRVGRRWFVATPNFWFPFELHVRLPFIHFLPSQVKRIIMGFMGKHGEYNLLTSGKLSTLFPGSRIVKQRTTFYPEILIACGGQHI